MLACFQLCRCSFARLAQVQTGVGGLIKEHSQRLTGAVLEGLTTISKAAEAADGDEAEKLDDAKSLDDSGMPPSASALGATAKKTH